MDAMTTSFGEVLLWSFWFFIWIAAIMVWFRCIFDLFGDETLSGWGKAGWTIVLIFVPWIGVLIYLIAEHNGMADRNEAQMSQIEQQQDEYIKSVAGSSPADQIAQAKSLLDAGTITQAEFDAMKAKALG